MDPKRVKMKRITIVYQSYAKNSRRHILLKSCSSPSGSGLFLIVLLLVQLQISRTMPLMNIKPSIPEDEDRLKEKISQNDFYETSLHYNNTDKEIKLFSGIKTIVKRASGSNKMSHGKSNNLMSFGQLLILAQEETKCLLKFGGQRNKTGIGLGFGASSIFEDGLYIPFLCQKGSHQFTQCEQCKKLTAQIRNPEECQDFCVEDKEPCLDLCISINQAVSDGHKEIDIAHQKHNDNEDNNKNGSIFFKSIGKNEKLNSFQSEAQRLLNGANIHPNTLQEPHVFCEGVDRTESSGKQKYPESVEEISDTNGKHFVVLKWNLNYEHLINSTTDSKEDSNFNRKENRTVEPASAKSIDRSAEDLPIIFVIERYSNSSRNWETVRKTVYGIQIVNVRYQTDTYKWRITAVNPKGVLDQAVTLEYVTLPGYVKPGPPKKIYVVQTTVNNSSVNVLIGWDPPKDKSCFYRVILESPDGNQINVRINEPLGAHRWLFSSLRFGTQYSLLVTSRDPSYNQNSQSNLTRFDFITPTCLESYNYRFDTCVPSPPRGIKSKIKEKSEDGKNIGVLLDWKPPQNTSNSNQITKYMVTISRLNLKNGGIAGIGNENAVNDFNRSFFIPEKHLRQLTYNTTSLPSHEVPGNTTSIYLKTLLPETQYTVMITAYSVIGSSPPAEYHFFTQIAKEDKGLFGSGIWIFFTIPLCLVMVFLIVCQVGKNFLQKRKVKLARDQYFQSMEERDVMTGLADWSIIPLTEETSTWKLFNDNFSKEKWEIQYENLSMAEVIGQGAFGVVRRARISRKKLQPGTLKFLDNNSHRNHLYCPDNEKGDEELETVAVKMLKVSATREDQEQLIKEIMTMQNLGFHSQIVGLIGACTKGRSLCLVLEFCPGGDLLTFIRKVRAKYWPTMGLSNAKKSNSLSISKENTSSSIRGTQSHGSRNKKCSVEESLDTSPINYADIEGFSDYSSSPEREEDNEGNAQERREFNRSKSIDPCLSPSEKSTNSNDENDGDEHYRPIDEKDVLSYARQIAMGMDYLEKNRIVHRDLASRNCLLMGDHRQVKISDFGLSRDIYTWNVYHQKSNGKLPIKWMAIESIFTHVFTSKSDVWSFGILLWELVSLGGNPYPGLGNTELFHLLKSGYRMERPDNCSEELYAVMKKCWRTSPSARPTFTELRHHVETMMEAAEPNLYLSLMPDIPSDYFRLSSRSDLLQDTPGGSTCSFGGGDRSKDGHYSGRSSIHLGHFKPNSGPYSSQQNPSRSNSIQTSYGNRNSFSETTNDHHSKNGAGDNIRGYTRSTSNYNTPNICSSNSNGSSRTNSVYGSSSISSSNKFILSNVPKRSNKTNMSSSKEVVEEGEKIYKAERESQMGKSLLSSNSAFCESKFPDEERESSDFIALEFANEDDDTTKEESDGFISSTLDSKDCIKSPAVPLLSSFNGTEQGMCLKQNYDTNSITSPKSQDHFAQSPTKKDGVSGSSSFKSNSNSVNCLPMNQLPYPFRHSNDMTIIENKTYDLTE